MNWFNAIRDPSQSLFLKKAEEEFTPKEIREINKLIINNGEPPSWALDWAKSKLESGQAPKEWIIGINKFIFIHNEPPDWAWNWAQSILMSGKAPQEWISEIYMYIKTAGGAPPGWAEEWVESKLESGEVPQEWIDVMNDYIIDGYDCTWAQNLVESGLLNERIKMFVKRYSTFQIIRIRQIIDNYSDNR